MVLAGFDERRQPRKGNHLEGSKGVACKGLGSGGGAGRSREVAAAAFAWLARGDGIGGIGGIGGVRRPEGVLGSGG